MPVIPLATTGSIAGAAAGDFITGLAQGGIRANERRQDREFDEDRLAQIQANADRDYDLASRRLALQEQAASQAARQMAAEMSNAEDVERSMREIQRRKVAQMGRQSPLELTPELEDQIARHRYAMSQMQPEEQEVYFEQVFQPFYEGEVQEQQKLGGLEYGHRAVKRGLIAPEDMAAFAQRLEAGEPVQAVIRDMQRSVGDAREELAERQKVQSNLDYGQKVMSMMQGRLDTMENPLDEEDIMVRQEAIADAMADYQAMSISGREYRERLRLARSGDISELEQMGYGLDLAPGVTREAHLQSVQSLSAPEPVQEPVPTGKRPALGPLLRKLEKVSTEEAIRTLYEAGYDPQEAIDFLEKKK